MSRQKVQHFAVSVSYDCALPALAEEQSQWLTTLADVFGQRTPSFDGYISSVKVDNRLRTIDIRSYIIEDPAKFTPIKQGLQGDSWLPFLSSKVSKAFETKARELQKMAASVTVSCVAL